MDVSILDGHLHDLLGSTPPHALGHEFAKSLPHER